MAEIKSSLEIALERAASFGRADAEDARREGDKKGRALARRCLAGDLPPDQLAGELGLVAGDQRAGARRGAAQALAEALGHGEAAASTGLAAITPADGAPALARLQKAAEARGQAVAGLERQLTLELAGTLADLGVSGSAAHPNPQAHPDYQARLEQAQAAADREAARAAAELLVAF